MATASEAPATMAEGPTTHTPNQHQTSVYQLMSRVMRDVRNVGKNGRNNSQNYSFRGVDDAIGALAQPLRDHGVFMTPEVLDIQTEVRGKMNAVRMRVAFHFYGPAGDRVTATTMGEASDVADKASNKAMSAALKYALIHTFMIPVDAGSLDDGDRDHPVGQRSPADSYMERLRKPAVWHNVTALQAMHSEARGDGLLDARVEGPDGQTTLGELLVSRGTALKEAAAEQEAQRAKEAPEAARQVAAEHGVPAQPPVKNGPFDELKAAANASWGSSLGLIEVRMKAQSTGFDDQLVPGPDGTQITFDQLLADRIEHLSQQPKADAA
ncbi:MULTISPECIES: ERF family protein [Streptomyces]|uniref:ERF family protein n=1 Tax=Streptomyces TaxID=1883 RepID=UPI00081B3F84|nr:ERF family protein [Streptomyces sp. BvitLS-983]MYX88393.1 hypothetical protein [Streptomyces sp. SID4915]SCE16336.1 ERF superfamily protein [Streptomyces sp. BvitLS-983]